MSSNLSDISMAPRSMRPFECSPARGASSLPGPRSANLKCWPLVSLTIMKPDSERLRYGAKSLPIDGTVAERYLRQTRGLDIPDDLAGVLRFHSLCPFGPGVRHASLVALFRDIVSNEPCAIHRIALRPDATKIDRKMLGACGSAAIKLTADEDVTYGLTIGEGIESTLAGMAMGFRPAWALGSAGSIYNFPVLAGIDCLTIVTDHDDEGKRAADACRERWTDSGKEVLIVMSAVESEDANDLVARRVA